MRSIRNKYSAEFKTIVALEKISSYDLYLMRLIDDQYTKTPFYGSRRMTAYLKRLGYSVNRKRVQRLMRIMGIHAIYPKTKA